MKSLVFVVLLAAAATATVVSNEVPDVLEVYDVDEVPDVAEEPALTAVANRRNLHIGTISGSTVLNRVYSANGIPNRVVSVDIPVRVSGNRRITAVRVNRIGASQNATPSVVNGGVGNNHITIRIRSATGRGYNYRVQVYASF